MKPKDYLAAISDDQGFIPTPYFLFFPHKNTRKTAREEAIAAEIIRKANPRENITSAYPWGPEESLVLKQLWIHVTKEPEWRAVPINDKHLYTTMETEDGELPIPNAVRDGSKAVPMDLAAKVREALGEE